MSYNLLAIADEIALTALGKAYFGNALYVAKDFDFLTDDAKRVIHRYLNGQQCGADHIDLQDVANAIKQEALSRENDKVQKCHDAFYILAIKQRDAAWREIELLKEENQRLRNMLYKEVTRI